MSKVVHLSDDAHARAKAHCQRAGLKMSEWVAALIERATAEPEPQGASPADAAPVLPPGQVQALTPRIGTTHRGAAGSEDVDGALPLYAAPPFWARGTAPEAPPSGVPRSRI